MSLVTLFSRAKILELSVTPNVHLKKVSLMTLFLSERANGLLFISSELPLSCLYLFRRFIFVAGFSTLCTFSMYEPIFMVAEPLMSRLDAPTLKV